MSLLEVSTLAVAIGSRRIVEGVSFSLDRGERLALVGESGSGKTLTALSLLQLLPHGGHNPEGSVRLDGEEVIGAPQRRLRRLRGSLVGIVFQEPMTSLNPLHPIGRQLAEAIALHRPLKRAALRERVLAALTEAGLADAEARLGAYPHQLSGGQRQRVMIAMALANDPALLIADEPTTALDVTIQAQILDLLAERCAARGLALLLITHDLALVRRYGERVAVMKEGRIVEMGPVGPVFAAPSHPYTRLLLSSVPSGPPVTLPEAMPVLLKAWDVSVAYTLHRGFLRRRSGAFRALVNCSFELRAGETLGVVGESGSGKTTLALALLRLERAAGRIRFDGIDIGGLDRAAMRRLRARMQMVFQDPYGSLSPRMSVGEVVAEGLGVHARHLTAAERAQRVAAALAEVGLPAEAAERYPHEFSGGQRQRIAIARAIVLEPSLVILDEPTSALDMTVQAQIVTLLRRLQEKRALAFVFISHDLRVVRALAHRVLVLQAGRVVEEGPTETVFAAPREAYTRELIAAAFPESAAFAAASR